MPPMPPEDLRYNVSGSRDAALFDTLGRLSILDFSRALAGVGRSFGDFRRMLEWGCGCGRILRHVPFDQATQEVHGCDIDPKGIAWLQENIPALRTLHNQGDGLPPLPYADGYFDLIVNHSVLTHLDEAYQDAWLAELARILSPDGALILTVHGPSAYARWVSVLPEDNAFLQNAIGECAAALETKGIYFFVDDGWSANFPKYYQSTFHAPWYIFAHWTKWFDIAAYIPQGSLNDQDLIVLRHKRAG